MTAEDSGGKGKSKTVFDQTGQNVAGNQIIFDNLEGGIGQIGNTINTGGGAYIGGNVNTGGGDFAGGDQYSGDFRGSNVNIKSNLENVTQTVGALPQVDESVKEELQQLLLQLNDTLQEAPAENAAEAEEFSAATTLLVEAAAKEEPDKTMVKMLGAGLLNAATTLTNELPDVISITGKIVSIAGVIAGLVA